MPDFEVSTPSQQAAALLPTARYRDAEHKSREAEHDDDDLPVEAPAPLREGLPAAYRMRHAPHYVEQLMGGAPMETVRQIALDHIDAAVADAIAADVSDLAASIGRVGLLQPLLVTETAGGRFQLLAGVKRLHAARSTGLGAAPCLVIHADDARAAELRSQAAVTGGVGTQVAVTVSSLRPHAAGTERDRESSPPAKPDASSDAGRPGQHPTETPFAAALDEITGTLEFVSALLPAASAARSGFQRAMIADIIRVETRRAAVLKALAFFLTDPAPLQPERFEWTAFIGDLRADTELEARLRGVEVEWLHTLAPREAVADRKVTMTAWTAILHAVLGVSQPGDRIAVSVATPRTRPAILFTVALHPDAHQGAEDDAHAFAGDPVDMMLRCAREAAERHGGQLTVTTTSRSLVIEFAAPQPLAQSE